MAFSVITQRTKFTVADNCKKKDSKKFHKVVSEVLSFMGNPVGLNLSMVCNRLCHYCARLKFGQSK